MKRLLFLLLAVVLFSCGKGTLDNAENAFGRYVSSSDSIIYAGSADLASIIEKTNYKSDEKINALVDEMISNINKAIDIKKPVYFTLRGALDDDVQATVFFDVVGEKEMTSLLKKNGFLVKKKDKLNYAIQDDQFIFFTNKYGVAYNANTMDEYTEADVLAFEKKLQDASGSSNELSKLCTVKGDLVLIGDLHVALETNRTDLSKLPEAVRKKLYDLYKGGYNRIIINSEKGYLDVAGEMIGSKELKSYFKASSSKMDASNLGAGNALAGIFINIDTKKLSEFLNTYLPGVTEEALANINNSVLGAYKLADSDFSKFSNGHMAVTLTGDAKKLVMGAMPQVNIFAGYGSMGGAFNSMIESELSKKDFKTLSMNDKFIKASTAENAFGGGKTIYPSYVKNYESEMFTMFVDVQQLGVKDFGGFMSAFETLKYIYATGNADKTSFRIYTTEDNKNFLQTALETAIKVQEKMANPYGDYDEDDEYYYDEDEYEEY